MDTQSGTGGTVPHFSQVSWSLSGRTGGGLRFVSVADTSYVVGRGDPRRDGSGASKNNCLIDSLRQCIGIAADCKQVRQDLINEFASASGRAHVGVSSYLDVEVHWRAIIRSLFLHNVCGMLVACNIDDS